jgi:hypothetical protein
VFGAFLWPSCLVDQKLTISYNIGIVTDIEESKMARKNISLEELEQARVEYEQTLASARRGAWIIGGAFFAFFAWAFLAA